MALVWVGYMVSWDASERAIHLQDPQGGLKVLADGDRLEIGGGGETDGDEDWVAEPDDSCPEIEFIVYFASVLQD